MFKGEIPTKKYYFPKEPQEMEYFDYWKHQQEARKSLDKERSYRKRKLLESLGENPEDKLLQMISAFDRSDFSLADKHMDVMEMDTDDLDLVEYMETDADTFSHEIEKEDKYFDIKESLPRYNLKSMYMDILVEVGTRKTIDYIIGFIENNDNSLLLAYRGHMIKILDNIDADYAWKKMQELAKSEKNDVCERANHFLKIKEMTISKQTWLENHLKETSGGRKDQLMDFIERYGDNGFKCLVFLGKERGMEEKLLKVGLEKELAHQKAYMLFAKISEIVSKTDEELLDLKIADNPDIKEVKSKLLERAVYFIEEFFNHGTKDTNSVLALLRKLENTKTEIIMLSALLKTAKEAGIKLTPENIRGMEMEMHGIGELSGDKKTEFRRKYENLVMDMMRMSYAKTFRDNPDARAKVEKNFKDRFENLENYRVYVLMFQGEAVAFSVIRPGEAEGEVISESTVVYPDAQKGSLGIAFLKKIFEREFSQYGTKIIRGKTRVDNPANDKYKKELGFVFDENTFEENGIEYYNIATEKEN